MKKIELRGQRAAYVRAIEILNGNLAELENELVKVPEVGELTIELLHRLDGGLMLRDLFLERSEEYIAECRPAPLESVKKIIREDFKSRIRSDMNVHDQIKMVHGLFSWFESQTGEAPDIVRIGSTWQVSAAQQKRLIESCTVALSAKQATYISLLDEVMKAKNKLGDWERENGIHSNVGIQYMSNPDTVYGLIRAI